MLYAMEDGRNFTNYHSSCKINAELKDQIAPGLSNREYVRELLSDKKIDVLKTIEKIYKPKCPVCEAHWPNGPFLQTFVKKYKKKKSPVNTWTN